MTEQSRALVIIPTYNEAENLEPLVSAILALDVGLEILIVDDNSPDGTGEIANRLSRESPGIHVLHRSGKMGLGTAYVQGFQWAMEQGYDYVFEMDCDFSHQPSYLPTFLTKIKFADLVIGSRYLNGSHVLRVHDSDDALQLEGLKTVLQRDLGCFGCQAVPPEGFAQQIAHLDLLRLR